MCSDCLDGLASATAAYCAGRTRSLPRPLMGTTRPNEAYELTPRWRSAEEQEEVDQTRQPCLRCLGSTLCFRNFNLI
eukprot:833782-Amphidinium_carterae.1